MSEVDLILLVGGSVGATALILWIVFRRSRTRSQLVVDTAHIAKQATLRPLISSDVITELPELACTVARDCPDDHSALAAEPTTKATPNRLGAPDGDELFAPSDATKPEVAAPPIDASPKDAAPKLAPSHEERYACVNEAASTAHAEDDSAESPDGLPTASREVASGAASDALLVNDHEELGAGTAGSVGDEGVMPSCCESADASNTDGLDSRGHLVLSPPEGLLVVEDDSRLVVDAIGDAGSQESPAAMILVKVLTVPDPPCDVADKLDRDSEKLSAQGLQQPRSDAFAGRPPQTDGAPGDWETKEPEPDPAAHAVSKTELPAEAEEEADLAAILASRPRPAKPTQHRDRRGQRRLPQAKAAVTSRDDPPVTAVALRSPAEAKLRLVIHPIRRTVSISAVLGRPAGYPSGITLLLGHSTEVGAYGDTRYDDIDLEWTPSLLSGEIRLNSSEGYQWLRSARRIHIFSELADEQGLMSVGAASLNTPSAIVCKQEDVDAVRLATAACGSPELVSHDRWTGVPDGWAVLSGYRPTHAASQVLDPYLTTLDPGVGAAIQLSGGLQVRSYAFAQGSPPKIEIQPFPTGARVTIDGMPAEMGADGSWRTAGWDRPGDHLIDVVPGPSMTYRIEVDPWAGSGWESWNAHAGRFSTAHDAPWAHAQICGASVTGPAGEHIVAAEATSSVIALGLRCSMAMLRSRPDAPVAIGQLPERPAFLVSSSGPRRNQGFVDWLAPPAGNQLCRVIDPSWVAAVRRAASRRLQLSADSSVGQEAWRRARVRARQYRKAGA